jgi:hypothetical protein
MTIPVYFFNSLGYVILWAHGSRDFGFKSEIFQHHVGGNGTHRGDSSSRVAGRSGHVEVPDGGAIVSIAWKRSKVAALREGALISRRGAADERTGQANFFLVKQFFDQKESISMIRFDLFLI